MKKRVLAFLLALSMTAGVLGGCGNEEAGSSNARTEEKSESKENTSTLEGQSGEGGEKLEKWPEKVTLTWYVKGKDEDYYQHLWSDMKSIQAIEEATNIHIEFEVAMNGDSYLNMMTAGSYPDLVTANHLSMYPGRLAALYNDGISTDVTDLIENNMPNYKKILDEHPDMQRDLKLDSGEYTFFSLLFDVNDEMDRDAKSRNGIVIRKDWLDAVGKEVPTTIDEWYEVLKAFKTQDPNGNGEMDEEPICLASSGWKYFMSAYGILDDPCIGEDGKVLYGFASDQYKRYLETMNKWYSEGLLYNLFDKTTLNDQQERVVNNLAGAWKGSADNMNDVDSYLSQLKEKVPGAEFVAAPWPKETADSTAFCYSDISSFDTDTTIITSNCKNREAAAFLLDYLYSEEGSSLLTWGIEGESYDVVDGKKALKPEMTEMVDMYGSQVPAMYQYADNQIVRFPSFGQYSEYILSTKPESYINACKVWSQGKLYKMPYACQLSVEQAKTVEDATAGMEEYIREMRTKFITGEEPLTGFDAYVDQLRLMGLDTLVQTWQECHDNYLNR